MRFIILGLIIMAAAGGFFYFMVSSDFQTVSGISRAEANGRIGQVAGGVGALGALLFVLGLFQRLRGR